MGMGKQRRVHVTCTATDCPTTRTLLREKGILFQMLREDALCDHLGYYWCKQCYRRYELINWAYEHNWPEVSCPPYKVGERNDVKLWKAAIFFGREEFILTLHAHIFSEEVAV